MHIFNSIFVHFVQFLMLDYGLDHFTSQSSYIVCDGATCAHDKRLQGKYLLCQQGPYSHLKHIHAHSWCRLLPAHPGSPEIIIQSPIV